MRTNTRVILGALMVIGLPVVASYLITSVFGAGFRGYMILLLCGTSLAITIKGASSFLQPGPWFQTIYSLTATLIVAGVVGMICS